MAGHVAQSSHSSTKLTLQSQEASSWRCLRAVGSCSTSTPRHPQCLLQWGGGMAGGVFGASLTSEEGRRQRNCSAVDFKLDNGRWSNFDTIIGALAFTLESKARHLYCRRTRWQWTGAGWGRQLGCWHLLRHRNARVALAAILCSVACLAACAACVNAIWTRSPCAPAIRLASDAARQIVLHTEGRALWLHDC